MIRPMRLSDYPEVRGLWERTPGVGLRSLDDSEEGVARFLKRNPATCFVAECDGLVVGAILGGHDGRRGYIYHACVDEVWRKQGIGGSLADAVLEAFADEGIHKAALVVFASNTGGAAFWKRQGFARRNDLDYFDKSLNDQNV